MFYSEQLKPNHFTDPQNAKIYWAVLELAKSGVQKADSYNIINILNKEYGEKQTISIESLNELIDLSSLIARSSIEEYKLIVHNILDGAFRRETYRKLAECQRLCVSDKEQAIQQTIYKTLDETMMDFSIIDDLPPFKDVVEDVWEKIRNGQKDSRDSVPFEFPTLNKYVKLKKKELILFAGNYKMGKSMMLMRIAVEFLKRDMPFLYIDSELDTEVFTARLIACCCKIPFNKIVDGLYTPEEEEKILRFIERLKTKNFVHLKVPILDFETIYTAVKKMKHTLGIDALICDYVKPKRTGTAHDTYQELGYLVDGIKNQICSAMDIIGVGAVQATSTGKVADSTNIERSASAVILIDKKTQEEILTDGRECGNRKLIVKANRLGRQFDDGEYIDLEFNGDLISFVEAKQHTTVEPF